MARRIDFTFDATNAPLLAEFWKLALGYVDQLPPPPYATREEWLASYDVPEDEWNDAAYLCDPDGVGPTLAILRVPEPKTAKNRLHLDIRVSGDGSREQRWPEIVAMAATLTAAGATVLREETHHHVVMADPKATSSASPDGECRPVDVGVRHCPRTCSRRVGPRLCRSAPSPQRAVTRVVQCWVRGVISVPSGR